MEGRSIALTGAIPMIGKRPDTIKIRRLERADVPAVLSIQAHSPEVSQWSSADYDRAADGEMLAYVALRYSPNESRNISGFLIARRVADEVEILNFVVAPGFRRQGIGAALLEFVFRSPELVGSERMFLEVRASNAVAIQFYRSHEFEMTGTRRNYYNSPREDAFLFARRMSPASQAVKK